MQLTCKFVPSSKVTNKELNYILTPDECVRQLSRMRKSQDVIAQLPKQLLDQLSLSARKDLHSLQFGVKSQLVKGLWVALALFPRQYPISNDQLSSYPALMRIVDGLQEQQSKKQTKAGYQQVADDVPLARNYTYNPVEPSPDKKIVVEFAGQWRNHAACLMLGETEAQPEKVSNAKPDAENSHRSIATFKSLEDEAKSLYIKIPCVDQPTPIKLKLAGNIIPVDNDEKMDEWENVLVPILPMIRESDNYALYNSGFFYVIWRNKVWRELEVNHDCHFCDVDIDYYRNKAATTSTILRHTNIDGAVLVPQYFLGGEPYLIKSEGNVLVSGNLPMDQKQRITQLIDEEVELVFPELDIDPIVLVTEASPTVASYSEDRLAQGVPIPHIWVPYKVNSEVQETFIYYSESALSLADIDLLEVTPESKAVLLTDLDVYSDAQCFLSDSQIVSDIEAVTSDRTGSLLINKQTQKNIAAVVIPPIGVVPTIHYLSEADVDLSDDFFELRNSEYEWSQRAYLSAFPKDKNGYLNLTFPLPPEDVDYVDILRGSHNDISTGTQHITLLKKNVPIKELLG
ncbi:hypothetical protein L4C54_11615 [Vibrio lamellibrachiae]|uniref:hypothetical protein n=1 Tax=Vibrio lamellibrachiae TaxID=2910253 RepID=UPI003D0E1DA3